MNRMLCDADHGPSYVHCKDGGHFILLLTAVLWA